MDFSFDKSSCNSKHILFKQFGKLRKTSSVLHAGQLHKHMQIPAPTPPSATQREYQVSMEATADWI